MLNHFMLMGRLVKDPEAKATKSGKSVVRFTLAHERDYKKAGEKFTDFIECVAFGNTANFALNYINKGRLIVISARVQTSQYQDKEGRNRKTYEIVVDNIYPVGPRTRSSEESAEIQNYKKADEPEVYTTDTGEYEELENYDFDLPF